uniref:Uncharacterized protein n=1 Tax=Siphoviridae sp. ctEJG5 TaxID=2827814 RepID=A0A8S5RXR1_9CAUD|nr:MAG TPA: hypothetical protein [Siphoviridae sp. ctEJG5]
MTAYYTIGHYRTGHFMLPTEHSTRPDVFNWQ